MQVFKVSSISSDVFFFLAHVSKELVNSRSTVLLLMLLAVLRIHWHSPYLVFTLHAYNIAGI
jgi:hypothetical protein